ncbi:MAG: DUF1566 domain-containing protein [Verrucomicrobiota bacterium]
MNQNSKIAVFLLLFLPTCLPAAWRVVDTGQSRFYNDFEEIERPLEGQDFFGQDAQYSGYQSAYQDNGDGTVSDLNTGLMWSQAVGPDKLSLEEARAEAEVLELGGYSDWRVPNIKELYSLIDFRGRTGMMTRGSSMSEVPPDAIPFINTDYFDFRYGSSEDGERYIDAQWLTDTEYEPGTMGGEDTLFGVNFADGRIKGYGYGRRGGREKKFFVRYVRGIGDYGVNQFEDNGDGTVTDTATGLMWSQRDSGKGLDWKGALEMAEESEFAGYSDWRLPNAKELQSIVDYERSPDTTDSAAIDPVFFTTTINNEEGVKDYPYFWTSTTHDDGPNAGQAVYVSFGRAIGEMRGRVLDVHGAGAQRSDPKTGEPRLGHGPQGDAQRVENFVRLVRGGEVTELPSSSSDFLREESYPHTIRVDGEGFVPAERVFRRPPPRRDGHGNK